MKKPMGLKECKCEDKVSFIDGINFLAIFFLLRSDIWIIKTIHLEFESYHLTA